MVFSAALTLICGRDDAELARRAAAVGRQPGAWRASDLAGTPAELVERIKAYEGIGARRLYLQVMDLDDLDHLELVASEVMRQL
jgi:hypothetical protein